MKSDEMFELSEQELEVTDFRGCCILRASLTRTRLIQDMGIEDPGHRRLIVAAARADGPTAWQARAERVARASAASAGSIQKDSLTEVYLSGQRRKNPEDGAIIPGHVGGIAAGRASGILTWKIDEEGGPGSGWTRGFAISQGDGWLQLFKKSKMRKGSPADKYIRLKGSIIMESATALNGITIQVRMPDFEAS